MIRRLGMLILAAALALCLTIAFDQDEYYEALTEGCTTDTDCAERFGGNGDPAPAEPEPPLATPEPGREVSI